MSEDTDDVNISNPTFRAAEWCDMLLIIVSILFILYDVIMDILLAVDYFKNGDWWFFALTVSCVVLPASILTLFNVWWYETDARYDTDRPSTELTIIRKLLICLMLAPLLRYFEALYYAIKSFKDGDPQVQDKYYWKMNLFLINAAILTVFEAFMECGPQAILQLYIFAHSQEHKPNILEETEIKQIILIISSVVSMSAAYASYQCTSRSNSEIRGRLNIPTTIFLFIWRFCDIMSRLIALGLFASVFPYYLLAVCFAHFFAMFVWVRTMETNFCRNRKIREFIYNLVIGEILVFLYFNAKGGDTRWRCSAYYILIFFENSALIGFWYYYSPLVDFKLPVLITHFLIFVSAIVLQVIYYYFLHPTRGKCRQMSETTENPSNIHMQNYRINA